MFGGEVGGDGKKVVRQFLCSVVICVHRKSFVVNHELRAKASHDAFHELKGKSTQAVSVGHHKAPDLACKDEVQKPREAGAVPVEA